MRAVLPGKSDRQTPQPRQRVESRARQQADVGQRQALAIAVGGFALLLGVVTFTPLGFVGVIGGSFWIPIAAVFLYLRGNQPVAGAPAVVTTAPAA